MGSLWVLCGPGMIKSGSVRVDVGPHSFVSSGSMSREFGAIVGPQVGSMLRAADAHVARYWTHLWCNRGLVGVMLDPHLRHTC